MKNQNKVAPPVKLVGKARSSESSLVSALLRYGVVAIVVAYLFHARVPDSIQALISGKETSSAAGFAAPTQYGSGDNRDPLKGFNAAEYLANYVCNNDHGYQIRFLKRDPEILHVKGFLAPGEAEYLIHLGLPKMDRSTVVGDTNMLSDVRTSSTAFLGKSHDKVVSCIEGRAARLSGKPIPNIEPLQVLRYEHSQKYEPHFDYFVAGTPGFDREIQRGGQRVATIFVYLATVPEANGGHTKFPSVDIAVPAIKNDAAFWYDVDAKGEVDPLTLHAGSPVYNDVKWGLNIWIREREFH